MSNPGSECSANTEGNTNNDPRNAPPLAIPCTTQKRHQKKRTYKRTCLQPTQLSLWGWPSRGGLIVLDDPTPPDFDFLKLDTLNPPLERHTDKDAEDAFCCELLKLGATWWDSEKRYHFVKSVANLDQDGIDAIDAGEEPLPTRRERRWVRVAWGVDGPSSLCVAEYDQRIIGFQLEKVKNLVPDNAGLVALARTMEERSNVLKRLGGKLYATINDYEGEGFLRAWEHGKHDGEVGPLMKTVLE